MTRTDVDLKREKKKLLIARSYWYLTILVMVPILGAIGFGFGPPLIWLALFGAFALFLGWIPFEMKCGRCGTLFFFKPGHQSSITPPVTLAKQPSPVCLGCGLDRR